MFDAAGALSVPDLCVVRRTAYECDHSQSSVVKVGSGGSLDPPDSYSSATAHGGGRIVNIYYFKTSDFPSDRLDRKGLSQLKKDFETLFQRPPRAPPQ